jgi:hypothetical protein
MKSKIVKNFIYEGFGFPLQIKNTRLYLIDNEWLPKIDVRMLAESVIVKLPFQKERLTGYQVKFIRDYFEMSLREFANKVVNESHSAVAKWEKFENRPTNMDINVESNLRLYILDKVAIKSKKDRQDFYGKYQTIRSLKYSKSPPSTLHL